MKAVCGFDMERASVMLCLTIASSSCKSCWRLMTILERFGRALPRLR